MKNGLIVLVCILAGCQSVEPVGYDDRDDPLTGWFQLKEQPTSAGTLIPVLKIDGTYYSVCRGFEVPLKQTPGGLTWALDPSSMIGTTIRRDPDGSCYIIIRDTWSENFTSESKYPHHTGPRPLTRIDRPSSLPVSTAPPPRGLDDFIGCYAVLWTPYYRITIHKEDEKYFAAAVILREKDKWVPDKDVVELVPFVDGMGFDNFDKRHSIEYNENLKRFEIVKDTTPQIRMPLVRIDPAEPLAELIPIGIPSWH